MNTLMKKSLAVLIAAPLVLGSGAAIASQDTHPNRGKMIDTQQNQKGHHHKGHKKGHKKGGKWGAFKMERQIWKQLDITQAQKDEIKELRKSFAETRRAQKQTKSLKDSPEYYFQVMQAIKLADNFDEAATRSVLQDMADKNTERKLAFLKHQQQIFSVLTPEQKETYKTLKAEKIAEMKAKKESKRQAAKAHRSAN